MFETRMFGEPEEPIVDYEFEDSDTGLIYNSPFPVHVFTNNKEVLGVGRIVGQIGFGEAAMPIVEIDDSKSPTGVVHLLESECWWEPATAELAYEYAALDPGYTVSAHDYAQRLDREDQARQN